jgi:predicted MFS family arabinose efflux permease
VIIISLSMIIFANVRWYPVSMLATFVYGLAGAWFTTIAATLLQTTVDPNTRARVASVFLLVAQLYPLGWLLGGVFSELIGPTLTLTLAGAAVAAVTITAFAWSPELRHTNDQLKSPMSAEQTISASRDLKPTR